jgi:general secretion pathway protein A
MAGSVDFYHTPDTQAADSRIRRIAAQTICLQMIMDYFGLLNLNKEPFSNSPDPDFFFHSRQHMDCLQKLELSLLLRRGLNVIIGDVGTGKTTLGRQLIRRFSRKKEMETHLILDPYFNNSTEFLTTVAKLFSGKKPSPETNDWQLKEYIKQYLFRQGVDQGKTPILIIDEGQKIPVFCLEILREFLNYETNEHKLLQIVIFAQREFEGIIRKYPNFSDRINLYHLLKPLSFRDTRQMIKFRLEKSSGTNERLDLFTLPGLLVVYRITGGYPRKIINLCHQCILAMIIQNRRKVGYFLARSSARRVFAHQPQNFKKLSAGLVATVVVVAVFLVFLAPDRIRALLPQELQKIRTVFSSDNHRPANPAKPAPQPAAFIASSAPAHKGIKSGPAQAAVITPPVPAAQSAPAATSAIVTPSVAPKLPATAAQPEPVADASKGPKAEKTPDVIKVKTKNKTTPMAAVKTQPLRPVQPAQAAMPQYSEILGQIRIRRGETLSKVILWVYGDFNPRYFKMFSAANSAIEDPDRVEIGQIVNLPAIPARIKTVVKNVWWVKVGEKDNIEAAINVLRTHPDDAPALRLISYWNRKTGTKFALVMKNYFSDKAAARNQLADLAPEMFPTVEIVSLWDENTVFFADPFFGKKPLLKKLRVKN